jgi:hypothetical protein
MTQRRWTHRFPKVDGYYWLKGWTETQCGGTRVVEYPVCIVNVYTGAKQFFFTGEDLDRYYGPGNESDVMWYGPLEEPGKDVK